MPDGAGEIPVRVPVPTAADPHSLSSGDAAGSVTGTFPVPEMPPTFILVNEFRLPVLAVPLTDNGWCFTAVPVYPKPVITTGFRVPSPSVNVPSQFRTAAPAVLTVANRTTATSNNGRNRFRIVNPPLLERIARLLPVPAREIIHELLR
jgi:hypothetical protein